MGHGPPATFAAPLYAYDSGYLPSAWAWGAQYLVVSAPPLLTVSLVPRILTTSLSRGNGERPKTES